MARWFAIQFGSERENILNDYLKDPTIAENFKRGPEGVDYFIIHQEYLKVHPEIHDKEN